MIKITTRNNKMYFLKQNTIYKFVLIITYETKLHKNIHCGR